MFLCLLLLSINLFVCHFVPPYKISEGIACPPWLCQFFCPSDYDITFTCKINLVLFVIKYNCNLNQTIADVLGYASV